MKKFLLTILFITMPAYAFENCMIISDLPIQSVKIQDENIAKIAPVFTIENDKKMIVVTPVNKGKTKIIIKQDNKIKYLDINVNDKKTNIDVQKGFQISPLDIAPKGFEILEPPELNDIPEPPKVRE